MNIEIQVNSTVIIDGVKYKCIEDKDGIDDCCDGCDLEGNRCCIHMNCSSRDREDKRSIIFKQIENG